jgi:hypothetical protein
LNEQLPSDPAAGTKDKEPQSTLPRHHELAPAGLLRLLNQPGRSRSMFTKTAPLRPSGPGRPM